MRNRFIQDIAIARIAIARVDSTSHNGHRPKVRLHVHGSVSSLFLAPYGCILLAPYHRFPGSVSSRLLSSYCRILLASYRLFPGSVSSFPCFVTLHFLASCRRICWLRIIVFLAPYRRFCWLRIVAFCWLRVVVSLLRNVVFPGFVSLHLLAPVLSHFAGSVSSLFLVPYSCILLAPYRRSGLPRSHRPQGASVRKTFRAR